MASRATWPCIEHGKAGGTHHSIVELESGHRNVRQVRRVPRRAGCALGRRNAAEQHIGFIACTRLHGDERMCRLRLQRNSGVEVSSVRLRRTAWALDDQQPSGLAAWYAAHDDVEAVIPGLIRIDVSGKAQMSCRIAREYDGVHLAGWRRRVINRVL